AGACLDDHVELALLTVRNEELEDKDHPADLLGGHPRSISEDRDLASFTVDGHGLDGAVVDRAQSLTEGLVARDALGEGDRGGIDAYGCREVRVAGTVRLDREL